MSRDGYKSSEQGDEMSIGCLAFLFFISLGALTIAYLMRR